MQDIKLLSHQLNDKIYDSADESAPAVMARLSIRSHSGSARLTRFGRCAAQSESSAFQIQRDGDRSGTCAKPDALSAAANARARARSPVPAPNAPPNSLPFPTAFPPSPAVFPPARAACTLGSSTPFPGDFGFIPGLSASRALPPAPGISHGPGNVPPPWSVGPRFSARGSVCLRVVPFPPRRIT